MAAVKINISLSSDATPRQVGRAVEPPLVLQGPAELQEGGSWLTRT